MVLAENLSVDFDGFPLSEIHLSVESGESFFLLGPSGAGKTLLLEALLGIRRPITGRVLLARPRRHPSPARGGLEGSVVGSGASSPGVNTITTRRFCARPSNVSLGASGRYCASPTASMRLGSTPFAYWK